MTPEEEAEYQRIKEEMQPLPPSPAAPSSNPPAATGKVLTGVNELIQTMTAIDHMRAQFFETEAAKMKIIQQQIDQAVEQRVQASLATQQVGEAVDPIMSEAMKILMPLLAQGLQSYMQQKPVPPNSEQNKTPQIETAPQQAQLENAQPAPKEEAQMPKYTQEQIQDIADRIYENFPKDVRAFKLGLVTRENAVRQVMRAGLGAADAERVVTAIEETAYPMEDDK